MFFTHDVTFSFLLAGQVAGNAGVSTVPWGQTGQQPLYDQYNAGGNM